MLAKTFLVSLSLFALLGSASEVLKRQSDQCTTDCTSLVTSCGGGPQTCPCTSDIQKAAQSCLNCLASDPALASMAAGLGLDPTTLTSQFNSKCAASSISLTIPQAAATGSTGGASASGSGSGSATPTASGASPTGTSPGSGTAAPTASTSSNTSSGEKLRVGSYGLAAGLLLLIIN